MQVIAPNIFDLPNPEAHEEHMTALGNSTPEEFFAEGLKPNPLFPDIQDEARFDRADNGTLYQTPIPQLRHSGLKTINSASSTSCGADRHAAVTQRRAIGSFRP